MTQWKEWLLRLNEDSSAGSAYPCPTLALPYGSFCKLSVLQMFLDNPNMPDHLLCCLSLMETVVQSSQTAPSQGNLPSDTSDTLQNGALSSVLEVHPLVFVCISLQGLLATEQLLHNYYFLIGQVPLACHKLRTVESSAWPPLSFEREPAPAFWPLQHHSYSRS